MADKTPRVTIRTNFTPPITFNPFQKAEIKKTGVSLLSIIQPAIDTDLPIIGENHYAPHGEPTGFGTILVIAVAGLAAYGAYKLVS